MYHIMNNIAGGRTVKVFGADLMPAQLYAVLVDNSVVASIYSDSIGVLETTILLPAGNHKIEISNTATSIASINNDKISILVFPNPTKNELNIITSNTSSTDIEVTNLMGELCIQTKNVSRLTYLVYVMVFIFCTLNRVIIYTNINSRKNNAQQKQFINAYK